MDDDFAYVSKKQFNIEELKTEKIGYVAENGYELTVRVLENQGAEELMNMFKEDIVESEELYLINSKGISYTMLDAIMISSSYNKPIPTNFYKSNIYAISKHSNCHHFNGNTIIKSFCYFHISLNNLIRNQSYDIIHKENGKRVQFNESYSEFVGEVSYSGIQYSVYLKATSCLNKDSTYFINEKIFIEIIANEKMSFDDVFVIKNRLDMVMHLLTFTKDTSNYYEVKDVMGNEYIIKDFKKEKHCINKKYANVIDTDADIKDCIINILKVLLHITEDDMNIILPFDKFNTMKNNEISFLEYYRCLEFISNRTKMDKKFLLTYITKYKEVVDKIFGSEYDVNKLEEEVRSLRNYYSHTGYYIDSLPIPTRKPKRHKKVTLDWIINVNLLIKYVVYAEVYNMTNIKIDYESILWRLK